MLDIVLRGPPLMLILIKLSAMFYPYLFVALSPNLVALQVQNVLFTELPFFFLFLILVDLYWYMNLMSLMGKMRSCSSGSEFGALVDFWWLVSCVFIPLNIRDFTCAKQSRNGRGKTWSKVFIIPSVRGKLIITFDSIHSFYI